MDGSSYFLVFMFLDRINIFRDVTKEQKALAATWEHCGAQKINKVWQKRSSGVFL